MAKINGRRVMLYFEVTPGIWTELCGATSHTLNINTDKPEIRTKCSGNWREHLPDGINDWSIDVDGLLDPDDDLHIDDLLALQIAGTNIMVRSAMTDDGSVYYEGYGSLGNSSVNYEDSAPVSFSTTITGDGELKQLTVGDFLERTVNVQFSTLGVLDVITVNSSDTDVATVAITATVDITSEGAGSCIISGTSTLGGIFYLYVTVSPIGVISYGVFPVDPAEVV
jgi:predicted secreted protein